MANVHNSMVLISKRALLGDIGDPAAIVQALSEAGIDTQARPTLYVCTFMEHDRPYIAPDAEPRCHIVP